MTTKCRSLGPLQERAFAPQHAHIFITALRSFCVGKAGCAQHVLDAHSGSIEITLCYKQHAATVAESLAAWHALDRGHVESKAWTEAIAEWFLQMLLGKNVLQGSHSPPVAALGSTQHWR